MQNRKKHDAFMELKEVQFSSKKEQWGETWAEQPTSVSCGGVLTLIDLQAKVRIGPIPETSKNPVYKRKQ